MIFDPNPLFYWMLQIFVKSKSEGRKTTFCNEGGSRSSKTYDEIHLIYWICDQLRNSEKKLEIYIARRTLKNCRELTYKDWRECLEAMGVYNKASAYSENVSPMYDLFGHKIHFIGLDGSSEACRNDIFFLNEALEVETYKLIKGWNMRCEMLAIYDWNPTVTQHWIFKWEGRPKVFFSKTTYLNNKHLNPEVRETIESFNPDNPENVKNGTADLYDWRVYGLGLRSAREGLVFPNVEYIDTWPYWITRWNYGNDFGFTHDPNAFGKTFIDEVNKIIYTECLIYQSIDNSDLLGITLSNIGITGNDIIIADSSDAHKTSAMGFVTDLRNMGFSVIKVSKTSGFKVNVIHKIKKYKIVIIKTKFAVPLKGGAYGDPVQFEFENYVWHRVNDESVNQPVDGDDHFIDQLLYTVHCYQSPLKAY